MCISLISIIYLIILFFTLGINSQRQLNVMVIFISIVSVALHKISRLRQFVEGVHFGFRRIRVCHRVEEATDVMAEMGSYIFHQGEALNSPSWLPGPASASTTVPPHRAALQLGPFYKRQRDSGQKKALSQITDQART